MTDRTDEIRQRCDAGRTVRITDVKYLLGEIGRLNKAHEAMFKDLQMRTKQVETLERERDEYKAALQNWHEDGSREVKVEPLTCKGCEYENRFKNEREYGYPAPCDACIRVAFDNYRCGPHEAGRGEAE